MGSDGYARNVQLDVSSPELDLDVILADPGIRTVVCCGAGGVGKTTTAAALALRAAEKHGRSTVVLTIDPARRLAQSLGLTELDNTPRKVAGAAGDLHAMMLDMKRTFDEVVLTHTDPKRAEEIFANPFYQAMSSTFPGTQEYMAMEKLGQLRARDLWDLIIVDTPPSRSALDFLDAPARAGGRSVFNLVSASFSVVGRAVTKVLGTQLLADLSGFVAALDSMFGGFRARAEQTYRVLQDRETAFLLVAAPEPDAVREAAYFAERLAVDDMPLAGLVLNRMTTVSAPAIDAASARAAAAELDPPVSDLLLVHADLAEQAERQAVEAARFQREHPTVPIAMAAAQAADIHDLDGLRRIGDELC